MGYKTDLIRSVLYDRARWAKFSSACRRKLALCSDEQAREVMLRLEAAEQARFEAEDKWIREWDGIDF